MALPNIFSKAVAEQTIIRINKLTPETRPLWGQMSVSQMLAHCNVAYEMTYEDKHPRPNFLMAFMIKMLVKKSVTSEIPYKKNQRTAPAYIIKGDRDFKAEKSRLIEYIKHSQSLGEAHFDNKLSHSLGKLTVDEWNNLFYKHLNHHLEQFGV